MRGTDVEHGWVSLGFGGSGICLYFSPSRAPLLGFLGLLHLVLFSFAGGSAACLLQRSVCVCVLCGLISGPVDTTDKQTGLTTGN